MIHGEGRVGLEEGDVTKLNDDAPVGGRLGLLSQRPDGRSRETVLSELGVVFESRGRGRRRAEDG